jgi:hypothetical protein
VTPRRVVGTTTIALLAVASMVTYAGCQKKIVVRKTSPDGQAIAYAADSPCFDGPCQSLHLRQGETVTELAVLAPDSEVCREVAWRSDSGQVAFLSGAVEGDYIRVFITRTGSLVTRWGPTDQGVHIQQLAYAADGRLLVEQCRPGAPSCEHLEVEGAGK